MAAVVDASTTGPPTSSSTSATWNHTCSGTNRLLVVGVAVGANPDTSVTASVTYAGVAVPSAGLVHSGNTAAGYAQMFVLVAPATGTNSVIVTLTATATISAGSVSFSGADQSTGIGTVASGRDNNAAGTAVTVSVPSTTSGNPVIDVLAQGSGNPVSTAGGGQTLRWERATNGSTRAGCGASSTETSTGGSVTMSYTLSAGDHWGILAAEVLPGATGPTPISASDSGSRTETATTRATTTAADSRQGSDAATTGSTFTAADTASYMEGVAAGQLTQASDAGQGAESVSSSGALGVTDPRSGTDALTTAGSFTAPDSGTRAETATMGPKVADSGTRTELVSTRGTFTAADHGTGGEGAAIEALYGDLVISIWAVDPATGALTALPDFTELSLGPARNGPGTITLKYPSNGLNFSTLYSSVTADRDLEVEIWTIGSALGPLRGYLQEASGDDVADKQEWTFAGGFLELRMAEAVIWPQPAPAVDQELAFSAVTPGAIVSTIVTQAKARGVLTDIALGFSNTVDSNGVAWPKSLTTKFSPGASYDQVLNNLVDLGLVEWAVQWTGMQRKLMLWISQGRGIDRTLGLRPIVLRRGRDLAESPRKWTVKDSATAVLAAGSQGIYANASSTDAQTRRGRRIETSESGANQLTTQDAVTAYAQQKLTAVTPGTLEVTHGLGFLPGEPRPLISFDVGDWVFSQTGTSMDRYRIVGWSLTVSSTSDPSGTVTLNDALDEYLIRLNNQMKAITSGDSVVGTSTSTTDTGVPLPPTNLLVGSAAFTQGSDVYASVTASWTAPTLNVDGTAITDLSGYRVEYRFATSPTFVFAADVSSSQVQATFTTGAGVPIYVRVRAYDTSGNVSTWLTLVAPHTTDTDTTPPGVPSTPVGSNYLGTVQWAWDGNTSSGADMYLAYPDFEWCELHMSTTSAFTPGTTTLIDRIFGRGSYTYTKTASGSALTYGTTYYAKLISVDERGNKSAASGQASATPGKLVGDDVFAGAIGTAALANAAVKNAQIDVAAVNSAQIASCGIGSLTAGTLQASMIVSTGSISTGTGNNKVLIDSSGVRLFDTSGNITVQLKSTDGSAMIAGEYRTALQTGARLVFNSGGSNPNEIRFYPSATTQYARMMVLTSVATGFTGQAGVSMKGYSPRTDKQSGEVAVFPSYASIAFADEMDGGAINSRVACSETNVFMSGPRVQISAQSGTGYDDDSVIRMGVLNNAGTDYIAWSVVSVDAAGNNQYGRFMNAYQNCGFQFNGPTGNSISVVDTSNGLINIHANAFVPPSDRRYKTDIEAQPLDAVAAVRNAPVYRYRHTGPLVNNRKASRSLKIGLMADELPAELTVTEDDVPYTGVDLYGVVSVLWGAMRQEVERADVLEQRVQRLVDGGK